MFIYQKGVCFIKGVKSKKGCTWKKEKGNEKQKENQNMSEEKGECDNKTNTKTTKTNPIPKQIITKWIPTRIKGFDY